MSVEGIFSINKPKGMTSQRAVQLVKFWARRKTGNKNIKVGHAGTLDPLATGVLVVGVGRKNTRELSNAVEAEKEYVAKIYFGETSATDDAEGEKTVIDKKTKPSQKQIEDVLQKFIGKVEQIPPVYSAIKMDGQEAYKRTRRGEVVEMKSRFVYIHEIEIMKYEYPELTVRVRCGKGTYIRSLARDIGESLEVGAYLSGLERTRVGSFLLSDSKNMSDFTLSIAVHAAELNQKRIDGTRVYLREVLSRLGGFAGDEKFLLYSYGDFNPDLAPKKYPNYIYKWLSKTPFWTQLRFAWSVFWARPDVVWIPLHNMPILRRKNTRYVVTVHDLAFKLFPETFTRSDLRKLNILIDRAVRKSDHIIAVSRATKRDLLSFYPDISEEKISVVHHGVDPEQWQRKYDESVTKKVLKDNNLIANEYILYVGAIQPRKNLEVLVDAFTHIKKHCPEHKLVLAGGNGWKWEKTKEHIAKSPFAKDIILTGNTRHEDVRILMQNARVFVFPTKYEGFGLPVIEAMAAGVPVVTTRNSSIPELVGNTGLYFDTHDHEACAEQVIKILQDGALHMQMSKAGKKRVEKFDWDLCARNTLRVLRK